MQQWAGNPVAEAQRIWERARTAQQNGEMQKAGLLLEQAVDANPDDAAMHLELARFLERQGRLDAAAEQLREASRQNPDDTGIYVELARIELKRGNLQVADRVLSAALGLDAGHVGALLLKAELAEARGQRQQALEAYHRVLARDSENMTAIRRVAEIQLAAGRPERAAPLLRAVCDCPQVTSEQRAEAQWKLGIAYGQQRRWDVAAEALLAALPHRREMTADDWYRMAYARYRSGDTEGAASDLRMAVRLQPDHAQAWAMAEALANGRGRAMSRAAPERTAMLPTPEGW